MSKLEFHGDLTLEKWWVEWFGNFGREIGSNLTVPPFVDLDNFHLTHRTFSENPNDLLKVIRWAEENKKAIWITANPFSDYDVPMGIEKLFYDFDDDTRYCPECKKWFKKDDSIHLMKVKDKETKSQKLFCIKHKCEVEVKLRKDIVKEEVVLFLNNLPREPMIMPLVVETNKGFHVYMFLERIFTFISSNLDFARQVYKDLMDYYTGGKKYEFYDDQTKEIKRLARVPLTIHEKWGQRCRIVKLNEEENNLVEDKVRSINYYRSHSIRERIISERIVEIKKEIELKMEEEKLRVEQAGDDLISRFNGTRFSGRMRPCFQTRIDLGEMTHSMRLAFLIEAYWNGNIKEDQIVDLFRNFGDFDERKTRYYVQYFLEHAPSAYPPYKCETIKSKGWCVESRCPKWCREHGKVYIEA